jgi:hypothetical protein
MSTRRRRRSGSARAPMPSADAQPAARRWHFGRALCTDESPSRRRKHEGVSKVLANTPQCTI